MNAFREIGVMADRINLPRKIVVSYQNVLVCPRLAKMSLYMT